MRRGTWILALTGVLALNNGAAMAVAQSDMAWAEDSDAPPKKTVTGSKSATGTASTAKSSGAAAQKPAAKNYAELFGDDQESAAEDKGSSLGAWGDESSSKKPAAKSDGKIGSLKPTGSKQPAASSDPFETASGKPEASRQPSKSAMTKTADAGKAADSAPMPESSKTPAADARKFGAGVRGVKQVSGEAADSKDARVIHANYDKTPANSERSTVQQVRAESSKKAPAAQPPEFGEGTGTVKTAAGGTTIQAKAAENAPQSPQVTVEWVKKSDFNVGQECQLELQVKNAGSVVVSQVAVDAAFPATVRLTSAEPKPAAATDKVTWNFDSIAPGAVQKIAVKLIPSKRGDLGATANVRFTGSSTASFRVEEPMLKLALSGPAEVQLGDPASHQILITNPGTGTAQNVKIEARLTDGLEHGSRGDRLVMDVGAIGPNETRAVRLGLAAVKGGAQTITVQATSSTEAMATANAQVNVIAPSLLIATEGPSLRYKGRNAKYTISVTNDGAVPNDNIRITHMVADGFKFVSADRSGKYDPSTKTVQWFIGKLEPGKKTQVSCELNAAVLGEYTQTSTVLSDSGIRAESKVVTKVDGIASLTLQVVDMDDPVEIGSETAYEIRIRNEGSKAASAVSIACELPPEMELKDVKAPADAIVEGRSILFKSLDNVAPGGQAVYKIMVRGVQEGTHRMRVRMTGANLQEPVIVEEATKVYADSK